MLGRLFGLEPAPAAPCTVLELGCGDGGNLLSLAQTLPAARFVGIDGAAGAVRRGTDLAAAAGLTNVELRCEDLGDGDDERFDYIIAHGVYSWVAPEVRDALLARVRRSLEPHGIAYVSYNAYPGSYLRTMARDVLRYHLRDVGDPAQQLAAAHELMQAIVDMEAVTPYARVLREQMERMLGFSDALLFHDDLAEISTPVYFHEFAAHAGAHDLQFLSEADLFESRLRELPESAGPLTERIGDDPIVREQYLDFFKNRTFRQTLLCHRETIVSRALDVDAVPRFAISAWLVAEDDGATFVTVTGDSVTSSEPHVVAALGVLAAAWPAAVPFDVVAGAASAAAPDASAAEVGARLCHVLLEAYLAQVVDLHSVAPPVCSIPGDHPLASPLARAQSARGSEIVSSLQHMNVPIERTLEAGLLELLDGSHDVEALCSRSGRSREEVDAVIASFAARGLLWSGGSKLD